MSFFVNRDLKVELQRAKDVLDTCNFVSSSTKGCYSSRIALWIHYCRKCCNGDETVTEKRLADYVEWMVSSGSAERIRQNNTHVQQVLRNQLQGVLCYWRIQNKNRADLPDPRLGTVFMSKWKTIITRFPRPRLSRRTEPIYGVQQMGLEKDDSAGFESDNSSAMVHGPANNVRPTAPPSPTRAGPYTEQHTTQLQKHHSTHPRHRYPSTINEKL
ncbi:hypothetical protein GGI02_002992 [Coemansia sp. RSA 2322]|nr:hypothetical protein GGI02_002992 [Coemansia sp. RSA 2322]